MRIGIDARLVGSKEGLGRHVLELIRHASAIAPENDYVIYVKSEDAVDRLRSETKGQNIRFVRIVGAPFRLREHVELMRSIRHEQLNLFHATFDHGAPLWTPCKMVLTIHDAWFDRESQAYFRSPWTRGYYHAMTRQGLRRARHILTVSNFVKEKLLTCCPWLEARKEQISVVPNGVGKEFTTDTGSHERSPLLRGYALGKYLLYVGALTQHKNIFGVLEGYAWLCRTDRHVPHLVVVGRANGRLVDPVRFAETHGIEDKVLFLGYVPDEELPSLYRGAEAFLFPSLHEGFGIPILEAMACGTPVVTSKVAAMPEVAGDAALFVDPTRPDDIGAAIARILFDPAYRQALARRGVERAREFSWEKTARRVLQIYAQVNGTN